MGLFGKKPSENNYYKQYALNVTRKINEMKAPKRTWGDFLSGKPKPTMGGKHHTKRKHTRRMKRRHTRKN
jgi:hypothetical protein